jgi:cell division protein FtsB
MDQTIRKSKVMKPSLIIVLGVILLIAMFTQLTFLSMFGTRGKEVANIRGEQKRLILENELLEAEINKMQSLSRVRKVATEQLGMVEAGEIQYISSSDTIGMVNSK